MLSPLRASLLAVLLLLSPAAGLAAGIEGITLSAGVIGNPDMQMTITDSVLQARIDAGELELTQEGDVVTLSGSTTFAMPAWSLELTSLSFDPDPFVSLAGSITNLLGVSSNFFLATSIPIAPPILPSSLMGGSTTFTYGDANFDGLGGLTNPTGGASGYAGTIDAAEALSMLNAFNLVPAFGGQTLNTSETQGLPGPTIPGPAGLLTIGIINRFNLSASDQATVNSTFIVEVVPEPSTALLLAAGLVWIAARRRP